MKVYYTDLLSKSMMKKIGLREDKKAPIMTVIQNKASSKLQIIIKLNLSSKDASKGLVHLFEHCLFSNVYKGMDFETASPFLNEMGIDLNAYTTSKTVEIHIKSDSVIDDSKYGEYSKDLGYKTYLSIMKEILINILTTVCSEEYYKQEKKVVMNECNEYYGHDINNIETLKIPSIIHNNDLSVVGTIEDLKKATYSKIKLIQEIALSLHGLQSINFITPEFVDTKDLKELSNEIIEILLTKTVSYGHYTIMKRNDSYLVQSLLDRIDLNKKYIDNNYKEDKHDWFIEEFNYDTSNSHKLVMQFPMAQHSSFVSGFKVNQDAVIMWNILFDYLRKNSLSYSMGYEKIDVLGTSLVSFILPIDSTLDKNSIMKKINDFDKILHDKELVDRYIKSNGKQIIRTLLNTYEGNRVTLHEVPLLIEMVYNNLSSVELNKFFEKLAPKEDEIIPENMKNYCVPEEKDLNKIRERLIHAFASCKKVLFYNISNIGE
ncbi:hypothetical protein DLH72_04495 [Candidatus Gracilibacteria bacterium]|nr:MAG: hypothetical protein DLH72_04495 [Candidatus Gracilibacteria bacterium]